MLCYLQGLILSVAYLMIAVVDSIFIITTSIGASIITALNPKDCPQSDNQSSECQDVVDNSGNIAADSDSMEGPGSVPLLS